MNIYKETDKFIICYCPKHEEQNASFVINKCWHNGKPKGFAYCFSCGHKVEYSPEFVDSLSTKETKESKHKAIDWESLTDVYTNFVKDFQLQRLAKEWNIHWSTLVNYFVGWSGLAWAIPMRKPNKSICGIQYRQEDGTKCCVEGSQLGLFIPCITISNRKVVITEGFSDATVATDLGFFGLGRPSAQVGNTLVKDFLIRNDVKNVTIVADNDKNNVGLDSAAKLAGLLEQKNINTRIIMPGGVKDLREFYQFNGREQTIKFLKGN